MIINPLEMKDRNIIVTGASSGIGRETSILLSQLGAKLILISRDQIKLNETLRMLSGQEHSVIGYDFDNLDSIGTLMRSIVNDKGKIHGLVHSAGMVQPPVPFNKLEIKQVQKIFTINFFAFFELVKHVTTKGYYGDNCSIVAISSISGIVGRQGLAAYGSSKAALNNLVKTMAAELAKKKIRVNTVSAGYIQTDMLENTKRYLTREQMDALEEKQCLGFGKPADVANAVAFLLSDASRLVTGTSLIVDGGFSSSI